MKVGGLFGVLAVPLEHKAGWVRQPARTFEKRNEILTGQVRVKFILTTVIGILLRATVALEEMCIPKQRVSEIKETLLDVVTICGCTCRFKFIETGASLLGMFFI